MWCNPCRAVGMIHCAYPDECGNMLSGKAAADNWKAWLDDLPLDAGFAEGIGQVQDFISGTVARAEAAEAKVAELEAQIARMIDADTVQKMLDSAQPIMAEACRGYEETIADLRTDVATLRAMQAEREAALQELRFHVDDAVKAWNAHEAAEAKLAEVEKERDEMEAEAHAHIDLWGKALAERNEAQATVATLTAQVEAMRGALEMASIGLSWAQDHLRDAGKTSITVDTAASKVAETIAALTTEKTNG